MSFISAMLMAYEPAKRVMRTRLQIERNLTAVSRMFELLDAPATMVEAPDARPLPDGPGEIRFDAVSFDFGAGPVLKGVTHTFEAGRTTALVGPSGGGKTTMMNLILRLYDPTAGRVLIDGADLRGATLASIRQKMAFVSQDTFLFSASVLENLRVGRPGATDDEVIAAARIAQAHDFITALPEGYATDIGENGALLSGGQKQRLAIARAVLRAAPILLLDEATSALDAHAEVLVRDALAGISHGVTTIVIAHRLSTILTADRICYVEGGEIRESGTLDELLALNGGFRRLYDQQFRHALGGTDPA
ncbi:MAG TPA: ABC transporter ATP-binding protein, partial [Paracoccaceae bacterium]|nr:ABC transporter ATP-binding protein [Paracoccaceae bacterium]